MAVQKENDQTFFLHYFACTIWQHASLFWTCLLFVPVEIKRDMKTLKHKSWPHRNWPLGIGSLFSKKSPPLW